MKRDIDLVRTLMLAIEALDPNDDHHTDGLAQSISRDRVEVMEHVGLLVEAGFVRATFADHPPPGLYHVDRLTWDGFEFLDSIRSDGAMARIKSVGADIPYAIVKAIGIAWIKDSLGLS